MGISPTYLLLWRKRSILDWLLRSRRRYLQQRNYPVHCHTTLFFLLPPAMSISTLEPFKYTQTLRFIFQLITYQSNNIWSFPTENWHMEYTQFKLDLSHIFGYAVSITQSENQIDYLSKSSKKIRYSIFLNSCNMLLPHHWRRWWHLARIDVSPRR